MQIVFAILKPTPYFLFCVYEKKLLISLALACVTSVSILGSEQRTTKERDFRFLAEQWNVSKKKKPPPPRLLSPFFARFLTLASRSLLRNSTETLATQASLTEASSQPLSHAYFLNMFSYLGKHSRLLIVWSYDWKSFSVFVIRITSILKKSTVSAQGYDIVARGKRKSA